MTEISNVVNGKTDAKGSGDSILDNTTAIVKAFLERNSIEPSRLPDFIREVRQALVAEDGKPDASAAVPAQLAAASCETAAMDRFAEISKVPVVPVEESIKEHALVCLIDGVEKKMLKRHLRARYGMEWEDYVAHFGLPADYPSVAPGYSQLKRDVAIEQGLGSKIDKTPKNVDRQRRVRIAVAA